jgi:hypothetical protein
MNVCPKCNKEHEKPGKFCSRSCANSRGPRTEDFKRKVSEKLKIYPEKIYNCEICNQEFKKSSKYKNRFCSLICLRKYSYNKNKPLSDSHKLKISETRKELFKNGELNVSGGTTKWLLYGNIKVQGTYEYRMCKILDHMLLSNIIKDWSYTNDRIEYININKKKSSYLLDFKVINNNEDRYYIETKGYIHENDILKWCEVAKQRKVLQIWFGEDISRYEQLHM